MEQCEKEVCVFNYSLENIEERLKLHKKRKAFSHRMLQVKTKKAICLRVREGSLLILL